MRTTPEAFAEELANGLRWAIWRNEEHILRQNFDRSFEANFVLEDDEEKHVEPKMYMFSKIVQIAVEEWKPIKDEYEKLHEDLKNLITLKILPRMDDTLQSLGE